MGMLSAWRAAARRAVRCAVASSARCGFGAGWLARRASWPTVRGTRAARSVALEELRERVRALGR